MIDAGQEARAARAHRDRHPAWLPYVGAAALYAFVFIAWTWPLARHAHVYASAPATHENASESEKMYDHFSRNDQLLSVWGATANARALLDLDFGRLIDNGTCWPLRDAATLGEHMIELGVLATPGYVLTGDPLFAYNTACGLLVTIAGVGMFALVRHWTGSSAAGLVAGFLFAFQPTRINNLMHPAVVGTHWIPFVLLYFDRVITSRTLWPACALVIVSVLASVTGSYPLLTLAFLGAPYAAVRVVQARDRITRRGLVALAVAVLTVAALVLPVLLAYQGAASRWYTMRPHYLVYMAFADLLPGRYTGVGLLVLVLSPLVLLFRGRKRAEPVIALAAAGVACALLSCEGPLWPGGPALLSLYGALGRWVPLLNAVRAPALLSEGAHFALIAIAGIGLARALAARSTRLVAVIGTVVLAAAMAETLYDPAAVAIYGKPQELELRELRPHDDTLAAYAAFDERKLDGPILDIPYEPKLGQWDQMPRYVLYAAYHGRPSAACYNSYLPPTYDNVGGIVARLFASGDPEEAAAAGFRNVVWHRFFDAHHMPRQWRSDPRISILRESEFLIAVHLDSYPQVHEERRMLKPLRLIQDGELGGGFYDPRLYLVVVNTSTVPWAHPGPFEPIDATLTWLRRNGGPSSTHEMQARILLPVALAGGPEDRLPVPLVALPPPGAYRVSLHVPSLDWRVTADELVTIQ